MQLAPAPIQSVTALATASITPQSMARSSASPLDRQHWRQSLANRSLPGHCADRLGVEREVRPRSRPAAAGASEGNQPAACCSPPRTPAPRSPRCSDRVPAGPRRSPQRQQCAGRSSQANPGDIRLGVVVPVDPHVHRLAPPPHGHNPRNQRILVIGMLVGDDKTTSSDQPARLALVAPTLAVTLQHRRLHVPAREAELLRLVERMKRPANGDGIYRHKPGRLATAPVASDTGLQAP